MPDHSSPNRTGLAEPNRQSNLSNFVTPGITFLRQILVGETLCLRVVVETLVAVESLGLDETSALLSLIKYLNKTYEALLQSREVVRTQLSANKISDLFQSNTTGLS